MPGSAQGDEDEEDEKDNWSSWTLGRLLGHFTFSLFWVYKGPDIFNILYIYTYIWVYKGPCIFKIYIYVHTSVFFKGLKGQPRQSVCWRDAPRDVPMPPDRRLHDRYVAILDRFLRDQNWPEP